MLLQDAVQLWINSMRMVEAAAIKQANVFPPEAPTLQFSFNGPI
jgi:hypothetical protein